MLQGHFFTAGSSDLQDGQPGRFFFFAIGRAFYLLTEKADERNLQITMT
jgi:hypothetical protein